MPRTARPSAEEEARRAALRDRADAAAARIAAIIGADDEDVMVDGHRGVALTVQQAEDLLKVIDSLDAPADGFTDVRHIDGRDLDRLVDAAITAKKLHQPLRAAWDGGLKVAPGYAGGWTPPFGDKPE